MSYLPCEHILCLSSTSCRKRRRVTCEASDLGSENSPPDSVDTIQQRTVTSIV